MTTSAVIELVERRTRVVRLPRDAAAFLAAHARDVIDVVPDFEPGRYRLTPRGVVGFLRTPAVDLSIRPKIPWPNVALILGAEPPAAAAVERAPTEHPLLTILARELARRLRDTQRVGLVRGYSDAEHASPYLRGRLRTADQLRDAARNRTGSLFHVEETVFEWDTAWNRIPAAVGSALAAVPGLDADARGELASALSAWPDLPSRPATDDDWTAAAAEPRAAHYAPLLDLCRLVGDGLRAVDPRATGHPGFLLDLGRAFERYLARGLADALRDRAGWTVDAQPAWDLSWTDGRPLRLRPDVVIRADGRPRAVLDAKWKTAQGGPDPADVHQALAYAALTGATHVGLVYPGRRSRYDSVRIADGNVELFAYRLRVVGTATECAKSLAALARAVLRRPAET